MTASRVPHIPRPSRVAAALAARLGPKALDPSTTRTVLGRYGLDPGVRHRNLRLARRSLTVVGETDRGTNVVKAYRPHWPAASVQCGHSILVCLEELGFSAVRLVRSAEGRSWAGGGEPL